MKEEAVVPKQKKRLHHDHHCQGKQIDDEQMQMQWKLKEGKSKGRALVSRRRRKDEKKEADQKD